MTVKMRSDDTMGEEKHGEHTHGVPMPMSTAWPPVMALGITLIIAGMVTNVAVSVLGLLLTGMGATGWFRQVLPHEGHESIEVTEEDVLVSSGRTLRVPQAVSAGHRQVLPEEPFRIGSGLLGGLAGGAAMTIPATLYGLVKYHSIWYSANLLAAGGFVSWAEASNAFLSQYHLQGLVAAIVIHGMTSLLIGLLYGAALPIFPRFPIVTAGIVVPLFFSAIAYSALGVVSPILNQRVDWLWFVVSQIVFGLVCGFVVNLQEKVRTPQFRNIPLAVRAGIHGDHTRLPASGGRVEKNERDGSQ
jgi:hypothetical protein